MKRQTRGRRVSTGVLRRSAADEYPVIYAGDVRTVAPVATGVIAPVGGRAEFGGSFITLRDQGGRYGW